MGHAQPSRVDDRVLDTLCARFVAWAKVWRLPQLPRQVRIEFSARLRSSLGRCHVRKGWIRLNGILLLPENRELLFETLCHEAAHVAVHHLYGSRAKPHGPEWRTLLRAAGFQPRSTVQLQNVHGLQVPSRKPRSTYEYRCTLCGTTYRARGRTSRYRCRSCVEAGRPGILTIVGIASVNHRDHS